MTTKEGLQMMGPLEIRHIADAQELAQDFAERLAATGYTVERVVPVADTRCLQGFRCRIETTAYWMEYDSSVAWLQTNLTA